MKPAFTPAQMQEMELLVMSAAEGMARHTGPYLSYDDVSRLCCMLRQAASQAVEIERLKADGGDRPYRWEVDEWKEKAHAAYGQLEQANKEREFHTGKLEQAAAWLSVRLTETTARAEAAESRLLALREQVEGLPVVCVVGVKNGERIEMLKRADVRALFTS